MANFEKKTWVDRRVEYPDRRKIHSTNSDGTTDTTIATIERYEGEVYETGTKLIAENMNDLEDRISTAFNSTQDSLIAGDNISIYPTSSGLKISSSNSTYIGSGAIEISQSNVITCRASKLYPAGKDRLGVIKPGAGLKISEDGTLELDLINADLSLF